MAEQERSTTCSRDCPDACAMRVTVEDGSVKRLRGDPDHPVTRGHLCFRTSRFLDFLEANGRLTAPRLRRRGRLDEVSWDEALSFVAEKLLAVRSETGPSAILHYRSGGSLGILKHLIDLFFDRFGPCAAKVGDICGGAGEAAQELDLGVSDSNDLFDLERSRRIILWGKNPSVSSVHLMPLLKRLSAAGAEIWLVDPVRTRSAGLADRCLQPRPGRDFELALGLAHLLFAGGRIDPAASERCEGLEAFRTLAESRTAAEWARAADVSEAEMRGLADALADGPTAILVGWGMQRRQRGAATVRALDALGAITGNLFRPGGGVSFYFQRRKGFRPFGPKAEPPRVFREPLLGADLLAADPPVRLLWVTAGNPVAMLPDARTVARAIDSIECVVVADCWLSDTARRADVVLPIPTLLEDSDLLGAYGHHWIGESQPVVPPPSGVRHEVELFQDLARRVGLDDFPQEGLDDLKRHALADLAPHGAGLDDLRARGGVRNPIAAERLFVDGRVDTPSGKVRLLTEAPPEPDVEPPPEAPGASGPLWLFSNSTEKSQASQWSGKGLGEHTWVAVHPEAVPGLGEGEIVTVSSPLGSLRAELRFDSGQRRDLAIMPKGGSLHRGHSANALIPARTTDLGLGAAYLDCLVRISRARGGD